MPKRKPNRKPKTYQVNDDWRIKSDPYCLILQRRLPKGKWVTEGYYPTLKHVLSALLEREIKENLDDLEVIITLIEEFVDNVEQYAHAEKKQYQ